MNCKECITYAICNSEIQAALKKHDNISIKFRESFFAGMTKYDKSVYNIRRISENRIVPKDIFLLYRNYIHDKCSIALNPEKPIVDQYCDIVHFMEANFNIEYETFKLFDDIRTIDKALDMNDHKFDDVTSIMKAYNLYLAFLL